jgi:hypothetical protein
LNPFWPEIIKFKFWHSKFEAASRKLHWMKGFWTMRAQLCSQAVGVGGGGDGDGAGGDGVLYFFFIPMPKRLLGSEPSTKRLKKDKARRKVMKLGVFMVNCCLNDTLRRSKQEATAVSVKCQVADPIQTPINSVE